MDFLNWFSIMINWGSLNREKSLDNTKFKSYLWYNRSKENSDKRT
ncbi:hypothetical protein EDC14_10743, partial [Hydrogenispora ethanolica]